MIRRYFSKARLNIARCYADLDAGSANETARTCMAQRGYGLVQKDQAEEARAAYATAAQRKLKPRIMPPDRETLLPALQIRPTHKVSAVVV